MFNHTEPPEAPEEQSRPNHTVAKENEYTDIFTRIVDIINKLPTYYIDDNLFTNWFKNHFGKEARRWFAKDFKDNPLNILSRTLTTYDQRQAIFAFTQITDLMTKNPKVNAVTAFIRNVAILDALVCAIPEKLPPSETSEKTREFKEFLKSSGLESDNGKYFAISTPSTPQSLSLFCGYAASHDVGDSFYASINSPHEYYQLTKAKMTLMYKSHNVEYNDKESAYIVKSSKKTQGNNDLILKIKVDIPDKDDPEKIERTDFLYFGVSYSPTFKSLTEHGTVYIASPHQYYCPRLYNNLSLSILDPSVHALTIHGTNGILCIHPREKMPANTIKDSITDRIANNIITSVQLGYSRGYAFVGVPGTGKTFLAEQIAEQFTDSVVVATPLRNSAHSNSLVDIFRLMSQKHMIVIVDDFDKNEKIKDGNYNQDLICMFTQLHSIANITGKVFTLIATINNPTLICNAVIKRSGRIDEVIRVDIPSVSFLGKMFNQIKHELDTTDYTSLKFRLLYRYMRRQKITLADTKNIYTTMRIGKKSSTTDKLHYGVRDMLRAVKVIAANKTNANEDYTL